VRDLHGQLHGAAAEHGQVGGVRRAPLGVGVAGDSARRDPVVQGGRVGHVLRIPRWPGHRARPAVVLPRGQAAAPGRGPVIVAWAV